MDDPPGTSGCPIVRLYGSIVWRLYPLQRARDKVREPAGGHRSLDPLRCSRFALLRSRSLAINLSLSDCFHEYRHTVRLLANLPRNTVRRRLSNSFSIQSRADRYSRNDSEVRLEEKRRNCPPLKGEMWGSKIANSKSTLRNLIFSLQSNYIIAIYKKYVILALIESFFSKINNNSFVFNIVEIIIYT